MELPEGKPDLRLDGRRSSGDYAHGARDLTIAGKMAAHPSLLDQEHDQREQPHTLVSIAFRKTRGSKFLAHLAL